MPKEFSKILETALAGVQTAVSGYAEKKCNADIAVLLPGNYLDEIGAHSDQFGLTALSLWMNITNDMRDVNVNILRENCTHVLNAVVGDEDDAVAKKILKSSENWNKVFEDFETLIVKRCLKFACIETKEKGIAEIKSLISRAFNTSRDFTGFRSGVSDGISYPLINVYVLNEIICGMQRLDISKNDLSEETQGQLLHTVQYTYNETPTNRQNVNNYFITKLYFLNTTYYFSKLGFEVNSKRTICWEVRRALRELYMNSRKDPLGVGADINHFYSSPANSSTSRPRDRFFRLNADTILAESFFIAFNENPSCFQSSFGKTLFDRILGYYKKNSFNTDLNGQRITIYSLYNTHNFIRKLCSTKPKRKFIPQFVSYLWVFHHSELVKRLLVFCFGIVATFIAGWISLQYPGTIGKIADGLAKTFGIASMLVIIDFVISTTINDRL